MSGVIGTVISVEDFLEDKDTEINATVGQDKRNVFDLKRGRKYIVPDFQREFRWEKEHVIELMRDISNNSKFLGNVILSQKRRCNDLEIIDGQQRITVLLMLIQCLKKKYAENFQTIRCCEMVNENFRQFQKLLDYNFDLETVEDDEKKEIVESDIFKTQKHYIDIWNEICASPFIDSVYNAKKFYRNLRTCDVNILTNNGGPEEYSIQYFLDVNLKGMRLDVEDIFKSYLFSNDPGEEIRNKWNEFRQGVFRLNEKENYYTLINLLQHYFFCDLYLDSKYKGVAFKKTDFVLAQECTIENSKHNAGEHIINVISNNSYMKKCLQQIILFLNLIIDIVETDGPSIKFRSYFTKANTDTLEIKVIHNLMKKIIKDKDTIPKILVMKYVLSVLFVNTADSKDIKKIYGIYFFATLFMIFDSKKSSDKVFNIVKNMDWYNQLIIESKKYFENANISDRKLAAQYRYSKKEEDIDERVRCKSLATIYNYFEFRNNEILIKKGQFEDMAKFIGDQFTIEHFIINKSKKVMLIVNDKKEDYEYIPEVYGYRNSIFNFIFIDDDTNKKELKNYHLLKKVDILKSINYEFDCEYSKMVYELVREKFCQYTPNQVVGSVEEARQKLNWYYQEKFKTEYTKFVNSIIENVIKRFS